MYYVIFCMLMCNQARLNICTYLGYMYYVHGTQQCTISTSSLVVMCTWLKPILEERFRKTTNVCSLSKHYHQIWDDSFNLNLKALKTLRKKLFINARLELCVNIIKVVNSKFLKSHARSRQCLKRVQASLCLNRLNLFSPYIGR